MVTVLVSKPERDEGNTSYEQVVKLAEFLQIPAALLVTIWLTDKISDTINHSKKNIETLNLVLKAYKHK